MFDTHCHLTSKALAGDTAGVIERARTAGVHGMVSVAVSGADALAALALARAFPEVRATAGHHPLHAAEPFEPALIAEVAHAPECVAWGELGLDNHYEDPPREIQDRVLEEHLALIEANPDGPRAIIIHCRKAFDDLLPVLRASSVKADRFVFHCFTGTEQEARRVLDFGASISFTGVVTFRNAPEVAAAAGLAPLDRIMVETDAPYLTPEPHRKVWPNEPQYVPAVARRIAEIRGMRQSEFLTAVDDNARRFFGLE